MQKNKKAGCGIFNIPPFLIRPNPDLARCSFSDNSLLCLADSIKRYGILQPLAVRLERGRYELIAGERRLRAAMLLGMATVPCVIIDVSGSCECLSLVENLRHERLTMFDEARAVKRLYEKNGRNLEGTASQLSMTEQELKKKLRLCEFSRAEMQAILSLGICEESALIFLDVPRHLRYYMIKLSAEEEYSPAQLRLVCRKSATIPGLCPDDLESFAKDILGPKKQYVPCTEAVDPESARRTTVVLKDLRLFEVSLRKICAILENAGCSVKIRTECGEGGVVYTVAVDADKKGCDAE